MILLLKVLEKRFCLERFASNFFQQFCRFQPATPNVNLASQPVMKRLEVSRSDKIAMIGNVAFKLAKKVRTVKVA